MTLIQKCSNMMTKMAYFLVGFFVFLLLFGRRPLDLDFRRVGANLIIYACMVWKGKRRGNYLREIMKTDMHQKQC